MASTEPGVEAFLILDEIYFSAFLCDSPPTVGCNSNGNNNTVITTQEPPIMTVPPTNSPSLSNICEVVPCNFESLTLNFATKYFSLKINDISVLIRRLVSNRKF